MFLRRIQVPNFRALKDVDITFEPEFSPRIFPLGSLNGGGKSTLLQLIFILLSCSGDPEKHIFIQNMLDGFEVEEKEQQKTLATVYLTHNEQDIKLQFFCHKDEISANPGKINIDDEKSQILKVDQAKFSSLSPKKTIIPKKISELEKRLEYLRFWSDKLEKIGHLPYLKRNEIIEKEIQEIIISKVENTSLNKFDKFLLEKLDTYNTDINSFKPLDLRHEINQEMFQEKQEIKGYLKKLNTEKEKIEIESKLILNHIEKNNLIYICNYLANEYSNQEYAILCNIESGDANEVNQLFEQLSSKLFLAAPFTQVFLFLPKDRTKLLFKESNSRENYYSTLEETKRKLLNLFTYDILAVDFIIELFKAARDKDFKQAIESGEYGDAYKSILKELNSLLGNKKINIDSDLSGVNFKIDNNGETKELYPEDLSHGELKRLSIYVWLKYKNIENAIVLMDEIENAFHPDWQYQIISDLAEWGASNQYILATHSYELCQALTPAHVKELEPKLLADKQTEK